MSTVNEWARPDAVTQGFVVPPGQGDRIPSKPNAKRKARSGTTAGMLLVDEAVLLPGDVIAPHRHDNIAEFFYVLEGRVRLRIGDRVTEATPGTFAYSPVGNVHGFSTLGDRPARLLIVCLPPDPGGASLAVVERYFEALERLPPDAGPAAWDPLGRAHGVERVPELDAVGA